VSHNTCACFRAQGKGQKKKPVAMSLHEFVGDSVAVQADELPTAPREDTGDGRRCVVLLTVSPLVPIPVSLFFPCKRVLPTDPSL
jgi:hypothetical protein